MFNKKFKLLSILIVAMLSFCMFGCSQGEAQQGSNSGTSQTEFNSNESTIKGVYELQRIRTNGNNSLTTLMNNDSESNNESNEMVEKSYKEYMDEQMQFVKMFIVGFGSAFSTQEDQIENDEKFNEISDILETAIENMYVEVEIIDDENASIIGGVRNKEELLERIHQIYDGEEDSSSTTLEELANSMNADYKATYSIEDGGILFKLNDGHEFHADLSDDIITIYEYDFNNMFDSQDEDGNVVHSTTNYIDKETSTAYIFVKTN